MEFIWFMLILIFIGSVIYKAIEQHEQAAADAKLRQTNPEAWIRLQELANEEKQRKHESKQTGAKIGAALARIFFGK